MAIKNKIKIAMKSAIRAAGFELKRLPKHRRPADRPKARAGDAKAIEYDTPLFASDQFRIEMAASCRDADNIPKVEDAGAVVIENGIPVQIMHNGVRVIAGGYHGEWMMELIKRLRGHHEPQEEAVFHAVMKYMPSNATSLEFGSHWSYYSLCKDLRKRGALSSSNLILIIYRSDDRMLRLMDARSSSLRDLSAPNLNRSSTSPQKQRVRYRFQ